MKKGFAVGIEGENGIQHVISQTKIAEELGFKSCWIAEDYFFAGAFSMATACAAATRDIHVGIGVLNPYTRHPALIAMESAALHQISNGRFTLGLGGSNALWIQKQMGIPFEKVVTSLRESIAIIRAMFRGETTNFSGERFNVSNIRLRVSDCADIPIVLGVKSEQLLNLAASQADGILLSIGTSLPYIKWVREQLEAGAAQAGRSLKTFSISAYLLISMDENRELARARCKERIAYCLGLHGDHQILRIAGIDAQTVQPFREGFLRGEYPVHLVTEEMIDMFSISGTPAECKEKMKAYIQAGVTNPVVFDFGVVPLEENMRKVQQHLFDLIED